MGRQFYLREKLLWTKPLSGIRQILQINAGIDARQLYPYARCQVMPKGMFTMWEFDSDMQEFKARHNRSRNFRKMS